MIEIRAYPLNCRINVASELDKDLLSKWMRRYARYTEYYHPKEKKQIKTLVAVYVFSNNDFTEHRIMRTMLPDLIHFLKEHHLQEGVHYRVDYLDLNIPIKSQYALVTKKEWQPRGEQVDLINFTTGIDKGCVLMGLFTGVGKAQPLSANIRVPGGWKKMGKIKKGDKIYTIDGSITTVVGVYPQGLRKVYNVHTTGNRKMQACKEHLFNVSRINNDYLDRIMSLEDIITLVKAGNQVYLPINPPIDEGNDYRLNPEEMMLVIKEMFIDERVGRYSIKFKHLMKSNLNNRREFVHVLMRTLEVEKKLLFRDKMIIDFFKELVFSVGYGLNVISNGHQSYYLKVDTKAEMVRIEWVEEAGEHYTQCIKVHHPSRLYITDDYIVTHNTSSALFLADELKQRLVCILRPGYTGANETEGWLKELHKATYVEPHEICTVSGGKNLKSVINMALANELHYKVILISNKTFQSYLRQYEEYSEEEFRDLGWNCTPYELPALLGVDTIFADEVHQDSHLQCKIITYLGCNRLIGASATIQSSESFVRRMTDLSFPPELRYMQKQIKPHVSPTAFHFTFEKPQFIRTQSMMGYSHVKFEKSVMRHMGIQKAYFRMICELVKSRYLGRKANYPESKCLIVVSTIEMARRLRDYLRSRINENINTYVENDPGENIFKSSISISTIGSSGTGLDIPHLNTVIMTVAVGSEQTNLQVSGRLRNLGDEVYHDFIYFVCDDIQSHVKYHLRKKRNTFPGKLLPVKDLYSGIVLNSRYGNEGDRMR